MGTKTTLFLINKLPAAKPKHPPSQTFLSVQALRAFAAFYVFIFHAMAQGPANFPWGIEKIKGALMRGYLGVDIFFVISGFILAWVSVINRPSPETPVTFCVKRFFRIVPSYWLVTLLFAFFVHTLAGLSF